SKRAGTGGRGWNRGTGLVFQFDQGQIGTLTPSPCSNPVPLFQLVCLAAGDDGEEGYRVSVVEFFFGA
ncbi:MAG: hypothetical protein FWE96_03630, partial [Coriobacteriia bacterium]|nr:hypothetical protein [Coriobacteriia bacterium]